MVASTSPQPSLSTPIHLPTTTSANEPVTNELRRLFPSMAGSTQKVKRSKQLALPATCTRTFCCLPSPATTKTPNATLKQALKMAGCGIKKNLKQIYISKKKNYCNKEIKMHLRDPQTRELRD